MTRPPTVRETTSAAMLLRSNVALWMPKEASVWGAPEFEPSGLSNWMVQELEGCAGIRTGYWYYSEFSPGQCGAAEFRRRGVRGWQRGLWQWRRDRRGLGW